MKTGKSEKGFTLIEILASISLITIIIIAVSTSFINYANFTKILENKLTSVHVAEELVTVIKNSDELALLINNTDEEDIEWDTDWVTVELSSVSDSDIYSQYNPTISIYQPPDDPDEAQLDLYRVKINIADASGTDQASLFTYFHLGSETE